VFAVLLGASLAADPAPKGLTLTRVVQDESGVPVEG
jgi:hypothetical protein